MLLARFKQLFQQCSEGTEESYARTNTCSSSSAGIWNSYFLNVNETRYSVNLLVLSCVQQMSQCACPHNVPVVYRGGGVGVFNPPPPKIPKALQNGAKLNPIVKTVKNCWI